MRALRGPAWLIVAAALLPLLLLFILQSAYSAREQRRIIEERALTRAEATMIAVDAKVERLAAAADALATDPSLASGDLAEFRRRGAELSRLAGGWSGVQLSDPSDGIEILSFGARPIRLKVYPSIPPDERARFVGFAWGKGCPCLLFEQLTSTYRGRPLRLRVFAPAEPLTRLLPSTRSEYPVSAIVDPQGNFVARTMRMDERFGRPSSKFVRGALKNATDRGIYRGTTLEGLENYSAFARSQANGWSVHLAMGSQDLDNPARRYFASLGFAVLLSLLLALALVILAIRQIAQSRLFAARLEQSQKMEALGQLTGGIAHDFNNMLTPIVGALELLTRRPELDERMRRLAEGGLASANRAARLTKQLLAFSRRQKLTLEPVELNATLEQIGPVLAQSAGSGPRLEILPSSAPCWALTDAIQLELALVNLIINARDVAPIGSTIKVEVRPVKIGSRAYCRLQVSDEGPGMDEEVRRRAFEPFFTTKAHGKGTGLGLAQVFSLARQSGGETMIDSTPGEGTQVSILLPACDPPRPAEAVADVESAPARPLRLLVAEDESDVRATLVAALEEDGHSVAEAADGPAALDKLAEGFDLLVADYAMPKMTGAELIAEARTLYPDLRFVIVTGYLDSDEVARAAPGVAIIAKPFDSDLLRRAVRNAAAMLTPSGQPPEAKA